MTNPINIADFEESKLNAGFKFKELYPPATPRQVGAAQQVALDTAKPLIAEVARLREENARLERQAEEDADRHCRETIQIGEERNTLRARIAELERDREGNQHALKAIAYYASNEAMSDENCLYNIRQLADSARAALEGQG